MMFALQLWVTWTMCFLIYIALGLSFDLDPKYLPYVGLPWFAFTSAFALYLVWFVYPSLHVTP